MGFVFTKNGKEQEGGQFSHFKKKLRATRRMVGLYLVE